jgi:hypothetical protein
MVTFLLICVPNERRRPITKHERPGPQPSSGETPCGVRVLQPHPYPENNVLDIHADLSDLI